MCFSLCGCGGFLCFTSLFVFRVAFLGLLVCLGFFGCGFDVSGSLVCIVACWFFLVVGVS